MIPTVEIQLRIRLSASECYEQVLIEKCWKHQAEERPDFAEINEELQSKVRTVCCPDLPFKYYDVL